MVSMVHRLLQQWEEDHPEERKAVKKRGKKKKRKTKKAWDTTTSDLTRYKLSEEEMLSKRHQYRSKHHAQAQKLVKQARKSNLAKKREEMQKKKQSMMKKWDKRIKKAKRTRRRDPTKSEAPLAITEKGKCEEEQKEKDVPTKSEIRKEIFDSVQTSDAPPVWEWGTSASSSMDVLDDKLVKLQKEFHQFESKVRKELREPEAVLAPTSSQSTMENLINQIQGLATQVSCLTQQVSTLQNRVHQLESETKKFPTTFQTPTFDSKPTLGIDLLGRSFLPTQQGFPEPIIGRKFNEPKVIVSSSFQNANPAMPKM